jgi:tRNA isopentenyl-2-thiomethyl-A-37 hydroxylase MiaE
MRTEAQQLDRYVETVIRSYARHFGDSGTLVAWMEQQAALSRKHAAEPLDLARADLLERLAREIRAAKRPHARH